MAVYGYRCRICQKSTEASFPLGEAPGSITHSCGLEAPRQFTSFATHIFRPAYNPSVGKYISSDRQFRDELKRASEEQTALTGIEHNYVPMHPSEVRLASDVGFEEQNKARRDLGWTQPSKIIYGPS